LSIARVKSKSAFQTWKQIERQVARGGLSQPQMKLQWSGPFLTMPETEEVLSFVLNPTTHRFVYPMFVFLTHTGARQSEMLHSLLDDFDFVAGLVSIREKGRPVPRR
jgi:hypothetical protein